MRYYSTGEVCSLLSIHPSTLRRWRRRLGFVVAADPSNLVRNVYTDSQVIALAEAAHRLAFVSSISMGKLAELEQRVAALEIEIHRFDTLRCW